MSMFVFHQINRVSDIDILRVLFIYSVFLVSAMYAVYCVACGRKDVIRYNTNDEINTLPIK